jgi:uncharacterized protein involved in exopolysaccharide biosynthesis
LDLVFLLILGILVAALRDRAHWIAMGAVLVVVAYFCWLPGVAGVR